MKLLDRIDKIFPEIEEHLPRSEMGIHSRFLLSSAINKAKSLVRNCSESSKLYLALTGHTVLSRCKKSKKVLEKSLRQIQNMVPVMLASKISLIIVELREIEVGLDVAEKEARKVIRALVAGDDTGTPLGKETEDEYIRIASLKLHITSHKDILMEQTSITKLLNELGEGDNIQLKKQVLMFFLVLLKKYGKSIASGHLENDDVV